MTNFYITNDYKLRKIYGYKNFWNFRTQIKGMYSTNLGGTEYLLVSAGGKLYYFLKSELEDDWEEVDYNIGGIKITEDYQLISTLQLTNPTNKIETYARYVSQDAETNTTTYKLKVVFSNSSSIAATYNNILLTLDGLTYSLGSKTFNRGQTTLQEVQKNITHNEDGTSPLKTIITGFTNAPYSGSAKAEIKFPSFSTFYGVEPTLVGDIGEEETSFFTFDKKVYVLSGKYHSWDGTTLTEVEGYTPLVFINTPPAGGGIIYDEINMLSSKKHQTFNGDGTSTVYHLAQNKAITGSNLASVDKVIVGTTEVSSSDYTVDLELGTVTFTGTTPPQGMDNVDIYWTYDDGDRGIIEGMRFGTVFGGDLDTRVFLYGNPDYQNRTYFSGLEEVGGVKVPSVEYFPATQQVDVGQSNFALTDLTRQYDSLIATTNRPEAYYMTISTESLSITLSDDSTTSRLVPSVGTFPLNEVHGNVAPGQGQLIDNYPVTLDKNALIMWKASNVRDERNMEDISQKIRLDLIARDLKSFKTLDHQAENQLWFGDRNNLFIYNYFNKTYSRITITDNFEHLSDLGNSIYMGTEAGLVVKWGEEFETFDGETIRAHWEMNFSDFDVSYLRKTMNRLWVLMQPQGHSSADIGFITNRSESQSKKHIEYNIQLLDNVDFSDFTFTISSNPQPFRLKMKAKKFTNLKIIIDNNEETDCTILQLVLKVESFGESK